MNVATDDVRSLLKVFEPERARHVAIIGTREYPRMDLVRSRVGALHAAFPGLVIVSGTRPGGRDRVIDGRIIRPRPGVDETAIAEAERLDVPTVVVEPDWSLGKRAGPLRNSVLVDMADDLVAFWDMKSRGTASTIILACERNILRSVYGPTGCKIDPDDALVIAQSIVG